MLLVRKWLLFALLLLPLSSMASLYVAGNLGVGFGSIGGVQDLMLADMVENRYKMEDTNTFGLLGLSIGQNLRVAKSVSIGLGVSYYYIGINDVNGTVHPLLPLNPDKDTLYFNYKMSTHLLIPEAHFVYLTKHHWDPYLLLGLGLAYHCARNYTEIPTDPDKTAAAMLNPFEDNSTYALALEGGLGIMHPITKRVSVALDYRYMNLGRNKLGVSSAQTTNSVLEEAIDMHAITLHLILN